jgi:hypothetical protein
MLTILRQTPIDKNISQPTATQKKTIANYYLYYVLEIGIKPKSEL